MTDRRKLIEKYIKATGEDVAVEQIMAGIEAVELAYAQSNLPGDAAVLDGYDFFSGNASNPRAFQEPEEFAMGEVQSVTAVRQPVTIDNMHNTYE